MNSLEWEEGGDCSAFKLESRNGVHQGIFEAFVGQK